MEENREETITLEEFMTRNFDERERKEIDLACFYAHNLHHGTDGHHRLMLISKLFHMIMVAVGAVEEDEEDVPEWKDQTLTPSA